MSCRAWATLLQRHRNHELLCRNGLRPATGLGSFDVENLAAAWPAESTPLTATTTTVTAANASPNVSTNDTITITVPR